VTASAPAPGRDPLILQIDAEAARYTFSWGASADRLQKLDAAEPRFLSSEVTGGFIGTYVGMYALTPDSATPAAFDWFDYERRE
jgi:alpha-N-arabinofuranosidase